LLRRKLLFASAPEALELLRRQGALQRRFPTVLHRPLLWENGKLLRRQVLRAGPGLLQGPVLRSRRGLLQQPVRAESAVAEQALS